MFSDGNPQTVDINSNWRNPRPQDDNSTQTNSLLTTSQECSSITVSDAPCQTDEETVVEVEMGEDSNPTATLEFLLRVEPEVTKILKQNMLSHAFDNYSLTPWTTTDNKTESLFTLEYTPHVDSSEIDMCVTALSWSATGSVLAAGYGNHNHLDLCWHKSSISTWNLDRHASRAASPDTIILVENCVVSLAFHPERAVILTGGVYNGSVIVWDLSREDENIVMSTYLLQFGHTDPVNQIGWIAAANKSRLKQYNILSLGGEGRIIIWEIDLVKKSIVPMFQCRLVTSCIPKSIRVSKARLQDAVGITHADISREDNKVFIVATECGNVFKCSLHGVVMQKRALNDKVVEDNIVTLAFKPHDGPVYGVACSPFHRNLFLTCSTDSTISVYSMLDMEPLMKIDHESLEFLFCVEWSPFRPGVFICGSGRGELLIYDLSYSRYVPLETNLTNDKKRPVYVIKFNKNRRQLVASGDGCGTVVVWELSSELCNQKQNELKLLERLQSNTQDLLGCV